MIWIGGGLQRFWWGGRPRLSATLPPCTKADDKMRSSAPRTVMVFGRARASETVEEQRLVGHRVDASFDLQFPFRERHTHQLDGAGHGRNQAREHADGGVVLHRVAFVAR